MNETLFIATSPYFATSRAQTFFQLLLEDVFGACLCYIYGGSIVPTLIGFFLPTRGHTALLNDNKLYTHSSKRQGMAVG